MLQVEHLTRRYGKVTAVDDLSFEISDDGVYGFLGPNGAGKSTTMNIMTGCLSATSGTVRISGYDIYEQPKEAKRRIGYLPEQPPLYLGETPAEYLRFVGEAKGLRGDALRREIEDAIEETGIGEMRSRRIDALSKGYRQRVGIAQALLGTPEIVILDEPTVGLDPLQILEIRSLIASLGRSRTVLISSHILSEVQTMCSKILIIAHGKLLLGKELADNLYLSLTDHIFFTVKRCREGMLIHNRLLFETKMIYKEEFQVGMDAVEMMNRQFDINLPEDEAAFLALHFVNATMGTEMNKTLEITKIVQEIRTIIRNFFRIEFQEDSLSYYRMMTHLKFFAQRMALHEGKSDQNADLQLFQMVKERYGQSYRCVERIVEYLQKQYHYTVSDNEKLYLTIHIERIHQN